MINKHIQRGTICWLHFHNMAKTGHPHSGDYAYIQAYAPEHSKKVEDDELYVKVAVKWVEWIHGSVQFAVEIMNRDGSLSYSITVSDPDRLTPIKWTYPSELPWAVPINHP